MTIIDPPIADNSYFYKSKAYLDKELTEIVETPKKIGDFDFFDKEEQIEYHTPESIETARSELNQYSIKDKLSKRRKWFILVIVALQGFLGPLSSSIYVPAIAEVKKSFDASSTAISATISLYVFIMGVSPLIWASLSERHGRRAVYLLATILYVVSTIGCALSNSVGLFTALRAFQSTGASAAQAVGAGTITDLFEVHERGGAMGVFLLGPLIGPVVGPIAGGFINEFFNWRYIFWFLAIMGGLVFLLILFFLPETSATVLEKREQFREKKDINKNCKVEFDASESTFKGMKRPFKFLIKRVVILSTTPYSMAYGFMYFMIATLPYELNLHYGFSSYQIGLSYLANGIGNALGAFVSGKLADRAFNKVTDDSKRIPEARLSAMWIGILFLPVGELIYGWCTELNAHYMISLTGLFLLGLGVGIVQTPSNTYIVDAYQKHSASVMSAANLLRCISAGCTPLIAPVLLEKIGNGWSMTILAVLSLLSGICIFIVQRYGKKWRQQDLNYYTQ